MKLYYALKTVNILFAKCLRYLRAERRGEERRGQREKESGEGRGESREVERLLLSSSKSTVNNAGNYQGRQKKWRRGLWRTSEGGKEGGREGGRKKEREEEEEGKHYSSVPSKHEMLGYFNKKPPFIWERRRRRGREGEGVQESNARKGCRKSWEMESESTTKQISSSLRET